MTNSEAIDAYLGGRVAGKSHNIILAGHALLSYGPHFVLARHEGESYWVNVTRTTRSTAQHRELLQRALWQRGFRPTGQTRTEDSEKHSHHYVELRKV